jgi:DNA (cytosine-5)-methyltransferase 1
MVKIGSLFSGIGGLELGLERATGGRAVWNCEQDEWCRRVLAKHWPDATQYTDVRAVDESAEPVDILCGGFPCQDLSVAGTRRGLAGERSGLWHEYARIIRLLRPRFVFVENVPALRTLVSDDGLGRVLGDLAESGYDAEWDCVPASAVGAPHVRDRIFILGWRRELADADGAGRKERRGSVTVSAQLPRAQRDGGPLPRGVGADFPPPPGSPRWGEWLERHPSAQPGIRRDADGVRGGVDPDRRRRLKALGNAVVPQVAEHAWRLLLDRAEVRL